MGEAGRFEQSRLEILTTRGLPLLYLVRELVLLINHLEIHPLPSYRAQIPPGVTREVCRARFKPEASEIRLTRLTTSTNEGGETHVR